MLGIKISYGYLSIIFLRVICTLMIFEKTGSDQKCGEFIFWPLIFSPEFIIIFNCMKPNVRKIREDTVSTSPIKCRKISFPLLTLGSSF